MSGITNDILVHSYLSSVLKFFCFLLQSANFVLSSARAGHSLWRKVAWITNKCSYLYNDVNKRLQLPRTKHLCALQAFKLQKCVIEQIGEERSGFLDMAASNSSWQDILNGLTQKAKKDGLLRSLKNAKTIEAKVDKVIDSISIRLVVSTLVLFLDVKIFNLLFIWHIT